MQPVLASHFRALLEAMHVAVGRTETGARATFTTAIETRGDVLNVSAGAPVLMRLGREPQFAQ